MTNKDTHPIISAIKLLMVKTAPPDTELVVVTVIALDTVVLIAIPCYEMANKESMPVTLPVTYCSSPVIAQVPELPVV